MEINPYLFAVSGLVIVFSGLAFLSFTVSNLHKILFFFENFSIKSFKEKKIKTPSLTKNIITETRKMYYLSGHKTDSFFLPDLIEKAVMNGQENPWIIIDFLIKKNLICPDETGKFFWNDKSACWKQIFKK
ncbi:MAG: hypothetical protein H6680_08840 [Desulfobacteraceae bacterium]|nr:hypothetical protein [Desulfobacteraceae bacterium]